MHMLKVETSAQQTFDGWYKLASVNPIFNLFILLCCIDLLNMQIPILFTSGAVLNAKSAVPTSPCPIFCGW